MGILGIGKKNGKNNGKNNGAEPSNGHGEMQQLKEAIQAQGQTLGRVIDYLNTQQRSPLASQSTPEERKDLLEKVIDPPRNIMPAMSNLSPLVAFLIPAMDIIKYNYMPVDQLPKKEGTNEPLGFYELWERSYYMHQLGKEGKQTIRLAGIAETRQAPEGQGIVAT